jgi:hypothetical protein
MWREWFRSTAAHNTVEIGGVSQAESGGPFLWKGPHPSTTTLTCDVGEKRVQTWSAEHHGYVRLDHPTKHRRSVTLDSAWRRLRVIDTFDATAAAPLRLLWHLGPDICVDLRGSEATLSWQVGLDRREGKLLLPGELTWTSHRADVDPPMGWYSPRFGSRIPTTTLVGCGMATSSTHLVTELVSP